MLRQIATFLPLLFLFACNDFLEEDISKDEVILLAPTDHATVPQGEVVFNWEELEGATSYRLQVVTPSFDSIVEFVADTEITEGFSTQITLAPGQYQWTVTGVNFGYETGTKKIFNLSVESDTAMDLSGSLLILLAPALDAETNEQTTVFQWQPLTFADSYNFQLASPDFSNNAYILTNELVEGTSLTKTLNEGTYQWRVRGQNNSSVSSFTERKLVIDRTPPGQPILDAPANAATVSFPVQLSWNSDLQSIGDTLYVYKDSLLSNQVLKLFTTQTSYLFNDSGTGQYFWRIRTVDKAGNIGPFSDLRKFIKS